MSDCIYRVKMFCSIGEFDGRPTDENCAGCNSYHGPPRGLGDTIDKFTEKTGIKSAVKALEKKTGKPCGCGKRRAKLNKMFPVKEDS